MVLFAVDCGTMVERHHTVQLTGLAHSRLLHCCRLGLKLQTVRRSALRWIRNLRTLRNGPGVGMCAKGIRLKPELRTKTPSFPIQAGAGPSRRRLNQVRRHSEVQALRSIHCCMVVMKGWYTRSQKVG